MQQPIREFVVETDRRVVEAERRTLARTKRRSAWASVVGGVLIAGIAGALMVLLVAKGEVWGEAL